MKMDFHAEENQTSYTGRNASGEWRACISELVDIRDQAVADIGCGGGIYSRAFVDLGAAHVSAVDFSAAMLDAARAYCAGVADISFHQGTAMATGLEDAGYDVVLERAVIHHVADYDHNFAELFRILKPGGLVIIQDRTLADVQQPPSVEHIRGHFFHVFPHLLATEAARRPAEETVQQALTRSGFARIRSRTLWETRKVHINRAALADDIVQRRGRSLLHALTDDELQQLVEYVQAQLPEGTVVEKDRWTLWVAERPFD